MSLIRVGNMVRIQGVNGFGFVKEIIWCAITKKCVFSVEVYLNGSLEIAPFLILDPDDCALFHSENSTASKIYAKSCDHEHAALMMREAA